MKLGSTRSHEKGRLLENCDDLKWVWPQRKETEDVVGVPEGESLTYRGTTEEDTPHETPHIVIISKSNAVGVLGEHLRDGGAMHTNRPPLKAKLEQVGKICKPILHSNGIARKSSGHQELLKLDPSSLVAVVCAAPPAGGEELEDVVADAVEAAKTSESRQTTI